LILCVNIVLMSSKKNTPRLLFSDSKGKVFDFPGLEAAGMKGGQFYRLDPSQFVPLPSSSELFMLPDRFPVGFNGDEAVTLDQDPYSKKKEECFAVAAFIPPGYTLTHSTAYEEKPGAQMLPLFAYAACVLYKDKFYAAAVRVDRSFRHDNRFMSTREISKNIGHFHKLFPKLLRFAMRSVRAASLFSRRTGFLRRKIGYNSLRPLKRSPR
jgi:hypothetical protein